jgi:excisionase family DNA binding protein
MATAIYLITCDDLEANQYRLALLVERAKLEGKQFKIFSEIYDKKGNQPLKKELLERVSRKEFNTILTYRLKEWSGSTNQLAMELNDLNVNGIRFISCYENFDTLTLTGRLYLQVLLSVNGYGQSFDSSAEENDLSVMKSDGHVLGNKKSDRISSEESPTGLNYFGGTIPSDEINSSGNDSSLGTGKNASMPDSFDLVGLSEASMLTGYSKNTLYQLTSRNLIPHHKRPHGRRIFFSKRALEQWILTGEI